MRVKLPDKISKIADMVIPYLSFDLDKQEYILRENAPSKIVEAYQIYLEWFGSNYGKR